MSSKTNNNNDGSATNLAPCDKARILVADDDEEIRDMFKLLLSCDLPDCRIDVAVNGAEVVEVFRTLHYGILIMDVRMPVMDGEEAFRQVRDMCRDEGFEMPSFVFCTGYEPPHAIQNIIAGDPRHCVLRKPVDPATLVETLKVRMAPSEA